MTSLILAGPVGAHEHEGSTTHPEHHERIAAVMRGVEDLALGDELVHVSAAPARREDLLRVHSLAYLEQLETFCAQGGGDLDADTFARDDSYGVAVRAAGAGLAAVEALEGLGAGVAFVPVRPPGHHAGTSRAMGFCLLNNIAISAAALTAKGNRVLIVDWDVHHGNGTQDIFWNDPSVLFVSTHQSPLYPGTGDAREVGGPDAPGMTVNVPLPEGATGDVAREAVELVAGPAIDRFNPDWVLVSCGFDAHREDPLGGLCLSGGDFSQLAALVASMAPRPGRLALFLEGGYSAGALRVSVASVLGTLLDVETASEPATSGGPGIEAVRAAVHTRARAIESIHDAPA